MESATFYLDSRKFLIKFPLSNLDDIPAEGYLPDETGQAGRAQVFKGPYTGIRIGIRDLLTESPKDDNMMGESNNSRRHQHVQSNRANPLEIPRLHFKEIDLIVGALIRFDHFGMSSFAFSTC